MDFKDIDTWRKGHLAIAELVDSWRIVPRTVVVMFSYGVYEVVKWYMHLKPYLLDGCVTAGGKIAECIIEAPTVQHTALLSAMFALSAAVFGFYTSSSRKWDGFTKWNQSDDKKS